MSQRISAQIRRRQLSPSLNRQNRCQFAETLPEHGSFVLAKLVLFQIFQPLFSVSTIEPSWDLVRFLDRASELASLAATTVPFALLQEVKCQNAYAARRWGGTKSSHMVITV